MFTHKHQAIETRPFAIASIITPHPEIMFLVDIYTFHSSPLFFSHYFHSFVTFSVGSLPTVRGTFKASQRPTLSTHLDTFSATLTKLVELIGRNNVVLEREPTEAKVGQTCVCQFTAERPFAAESIHEMPRLSRFLIKHNRQVAAIGFIRLKLD